MTGAGERARELAHAINGNGALKSQVDEAAKLIEGALAAVRLEATASLRADCVELMAKWRAHGEAQDTQGLAFGVDGEDFRDCANDLEVALERAVEGK